MNLIEKYVREVGIRLPKKQRDDVETELRSLLSDMVEDRAQTKVAQADEEIIMDVLREFGSPVEVANSYQPRINHLIGAELFPIFKQVVTIVLSVLSVLALVGITVSVSGSDTFFQDFIQRFTTGFFDFIGRLSYVFANIVIVFAIIERVVPADELSRDADKEWDPNSLKKIDDSTHINRFESVFGIVFGIIFLVILNRFPNQGAIVYFEDVQIQTFDLFSANFYERLLLWVNLSLIVSLGVDIYKLWRGKRTPLLGWMEVVKTFLSALVIYLFMTQGPVFDLRIGATALEGFEALNELLHTMLRIGFPIVFVILLITVVKKIYDLLRPSSMPSLTLDT